MCASVSEILESVLQTETIYIQTVHTYRLIQKTMCRIHIHILSTHSVLLRHTYSYQYTWYTVCTHSTLCTHIYTIVCGKKRCNRLYKGRIRNVMDVHWMVSSGWPITRDLSVRSKFNTNSLKKLVQPKNENDVIIYSSSCVLNLYEFHSSVEHKNIPSNWAIDFHSIFCHTLEVNAYGQLKTLLLNQMDSNLFTNGKS